MQIYYLPLIYQQQYIQEQQQCTLSPGSLSYNLKLPKIDRNKDVAFNYTNMTHDFFLF